MLNQDAATVSSEPDLIQDVSYVEPDSNKFLKTSSEVSLVIVHGFILIVLLCCVNDVMPAGEGGIYYKSTRFAIPTATVLRFLGFWDVAHCLACCVIDLVLSKFIGVLRITRVCRKKSVRNQWLNVSVIMIMISLRCFK